jgi:hypothetical protein
LQNTGAVGAILIFSLEQAASFKGIPAWGALFGSKRRRLSLAIENC